MQQSFPGPSALTVREFCHRFSISRTTFYEEVKAHRLEIRKIGQKSIVLRDEADRWLAALPSSRAGHRSAEVSR